MSAQPNKARISIPEGRYTFSNATDCVEEVTTLSKATGWARFFSCGFILEPNKAKPKQKERLTGESLQNRVRISLMFFLRSWLSCRHLWAPQRMPGLTFLSWDGQQGPSKIPCRAALADICAFAYITRTVYSRTITSTFILLFCSQFASISPLHTCITDRTVFLCAALSCTVLLFCPVPWCTCPVPYPAIVA